VQAQPAALLASLPVGFLLTSVVGYAALTHLARYALPPTRLRFSHALRFRHRVPQGVADEQRGAAKGCVGVAAEGHRSSQQ
jgi:hypothetical protein